MFEVKKYLSIVNKDGFSELRDDDMFVLEECKIFNSSLVDCRVILMKDKIPEVLDFVDNNLQNPTYVYNLLSKNPVKGMDLLANMLKISSYTNEFIKAYGGVQEVLDLFKPIHSVPEGLVTQRFSVTDSADSNPLDGDLFDSGFDSVDNVEEDTFGLEIESDLDRELSIGLSFDPVQDSGTEDLDNGVGAGKQSSVTSGFDSNSVKAPVVDTVQTEAEVAQSVLPRPIQIDTASMKVPDSAQEPSQRVSAPSTQVDLKSSDNKTHGLEKEAIVKDIAVGNSEGLAGGMQRSSRNDDFTNFKENFELVTKSGVREEFADMMLIIRAMAAKMGVMIDDVEDDDSVMNHDDLLSAKVYINDLATSTVRDGVIAVLDRAETRDELRAVTTFMAMFISYMREV